MNTLKPLLVMCYFSVCFLMFISNCSSCLTSSHADKEPAWGCSSARVHQRLVTEAVAQLGARSLLDTAAWPHRIPHFSCQHKRQVRGFQQHPANPQCKGKKELCTHHPEVLQALPWSSCGAKAKRGSTVHPMQCQGRAQLWEMRNTSMSPEKSRP